MKNIVFIGGTSYSGSTMLGMMLGNSPISFTVGEIRGLFQPRRLQHINPPCGCNNDRCSLWGDIKRAGVYNAYDEIFKRFPSINTIIDSSKDPLWIKQQLMNLKSKGVSTHIVLIWKTPAEFAFSRLKRDALSRWKRAWINYHRLFFSLISGWRSIRYFDLVSEPAKKLNEICLFLGLPYREGMEKYWEKTHHTLFGNTSAKYHTFELDSDDYKRSVKTLSLMHNNSTNKDSIAENRYRSIYHNVDVEKLLPRSILHDATNDTFDKYTSILKSHDFNAKFLDNCNGPINCTKLSTSWARISLIRTKRFLERIIFSIRYPKSFKY